MKVADLVARLQQFDQNATLEIITAHGATYVAWEAGSVYDDTNPVYNKTPTAVVTKVTIELDPARGEAQA